MFDLSKEKIEELSKSDIKLQILQIVFKTLSSADFSVEEFRPDLDIKSGHVGDIVTNISVIDDDGTIIKISGRNLLK